MRSSTLRKISLLPLGFVVIAVSMMMLGANEVSPQNYPSKPIRIVTSAIGGPNDFASRLIAQALSASLGQPVIVDNRTSFISAETVAKAPYDGYTLLVAGNPLWILPLMQNVPYDPARDFLPVTLVSRQPNILVVHPSVTAISVKELIALAKAKPGTLNFASAAAGGSSQLAAELFKAMAAVDMVSVPYKGAGPAIIGLLSGQVQLSFAAAVSAMPHMKSGKLRGLAVTSADASAFAPELPTVAASGLPGYESVLVLGMFVPARTPAVVVNRLSQEVMPFLKRTDVKEKFLNGGIEAVGSSAQELASYITSEAARMGKVIKDAGIKAE